MLKPVGFSPEIPEVAIRDAAFPAPFASGLEFSPPARGAWNIVHTAMLVPEAHQIYACAKGCMRGVILTAAEMNAMDRMSWVAVEERDLVSGSIETGVIEGCAHILGKMKKKPRCVMVFLSCVQLFAGVDFASIIAELSARFPAIDFIDCYMHPTMRKSGLTPEQSLRKQMYSPLAPCPEKPRTAAFLGNDLATSPEAEIVRLLTAQGWEVRELAACRTYDDFLRLAESGLFLTTLPVANPGAEHLAERLGRKHLYLPAAYSFAENRENLARLAEFLQVPCPDCRAAEDAAHRALEQARGTLDGMPVAIDYSATPRPLGLARLLLEHGFRIEQVFLDVVSPEEKNDFLYLQSAPPGLRLAPTVHAAMRFGAGQAPGTLAVGQKAAYFCGTRHFVNMVEGGGLYGFSGIARLAERIVEAATTELDTEKVIRCKGLGCESCLV